MNDMSFKTHDHLTRTFSAHQKGEEYRVSGWIVILCTQPSHILSLSPSRLPLSSKVKYQSSAFSSAETFTK